jgi:hypothetical protein
MLHFSSIQVLARLTIGMKLCMVALKEPGLDSLNIGGGFPSKFFSV